VCELEQTYKEVEVLFLPVVSAEIYFQTQEIRKCLCLGFLSLAPFFLLVSCCAKGGKMAAKKFLLADWPVANLIAMHFLGSPWQRCATRNRRGKMKKGGTAYPIKDRKAFEATYWKLRDKQARSDKSICKQKTQLCTFLV